LALLLYPRNPTKDNQETAEIAPLVMALLQNVVEGARRRLLIVGLAGQAASS
jgi:hypothetical protein